jgi:glycosyltransferase involved in cell wall biosynthesis
MKILFINISDIQGGAAKAAYRLGKSLEKDFGTTNLFLVRTKLTDDPNVIETRKTKVQAIIERLVNIFMNVIGLQYQWLPFSPNFILKKAHEFNPDIISLHNTIGGYFRTKDLIKLSKIAPIVWTFHDMWPFTNNGAHTYGNNSWQDLESFSGENKIFPWTGINWGGWLLKQKQKIYSQSNITLITPSKWMYELAKKSPVFLNKKIFQVYHGIDTSVFKPLEKIKSKDKLGINKNDKVLLFVAEKTGKSGSKLEKILSSINTSTEFPITFIIIGEKTGKEYYFQNLKIIEAGYISDEKRLAEYYSAADLFVYPTLAESFGLVLAEAISCGTPCITDNIGPISEIIVNNYNGVILEYSTPEEYSKHILDLLLDEKRLNEYSRNAIEFAQENFSIKLMAKEYSNIFNSVYS